MQNAFTSLIAALVIQGVLLIGALVLEAFLARSERAWPGLVLPGVWLLLSLLLVVGNALYVDSLAQTIGAIAVALVLFNIPTLLLIAVYCAVRARKRRRSQIDKMNIQDL